MDEKGFTLVELLATIVIMGLLIAVISPSVVNLQKNNRTKRFELYGKTMIEAAKLYVEKEGDDITELGISDWEGCVDIDYQDLVNNKLIKVFDDTDYDCSESKVRLTKQINSSSYNYNLICKSKKSSKKDYTLKNIEDSTCSVHQYTSTS